MFETLTQFLESQTDEQKQILHEGISELLETLEPEEIEIAENFVYTFANVNLPLYSGVYSFEAFKKYSVINALDEQSIIAAYRTALQNQTPEPAIILTDIDELDDFINFTIISVIYNPTNLAMRGPRLVIDRPGTSQDKFTYGQAYYNKLFFNECCTAKNYEAIMEILRSTGFVPSISTYPKVNANQFGFTESEEFVKEVLKKLPGERIDIRGLRFSSAQDRKDNADALKAAGWVKVIS